MGLSLLKSRNKCDFLQNGQRIPLNEGLLGWYLAFHLPIVGGTTATARDSNRSGLAVHEIEIPPSSLAAAPHNMLAAKSMPTLSMLGQQSRCRTDRTDRETSWLSLLLKSSDGNANPCIRPFSEFLTAGIIIHTSHLMALGEARTFFLYEYVYCKPHKKP
ncbi:uncharacterized protein B0I36DRAFT_323252, partial [Microdochium trichocladiopsis]